MREVFLEVLHEGDALPAGYVGLGRERVEPAGGVELVFEVFAVAIEADRGGLVGRSGGGLLAVSTRWVGQ